MNLVSHVFKREKSYFLCAAVSPVDLTVVKQLTQFNLLQFIFFPV